MRYTLSIGQGNSVLCRWGQVLQQCGYTEIRMAKIAHHLFSMDLEKKRNRYFVP